MAVYPVSIPGRSTLYIRATKAEITGEMRRLGIKNFKIQNAVPKNMLSKVKLTSLLNVKKSSVAGLGKTPGGPNNPGMKINKTTTKTKVKVGSATGSKSKIGSATGSKSKTTTKIGVKPNVKVGSATGGKPKTVTKTKTLSVQQKINNLAKKVKAKAPNVSMSKITDTIRGMIRKHPLTAVAGAGGIGIAIGAILASLKPSKIEKSTITEGIVVRSTKGGQKERKSDKELIKTKKSKVSQPKTKPKYKSSVTIVLPKPKPKLFNGKKKTNGGSSGRMFNLIVGGKGPAKVRLAEIDAENKLEKQLGRRPSKKEVIAYLKKN